MANNIYIGNRYVPIFANPVEWDNLREYEPLTIVTYQGTAYTSRKTVPVGTALSNTEYWVVTGNYNAQVEMYRREVDKIKDAYYVLTGIGGIGDGSADNTGVINTFISKIGNKQCTLIVNPGTFKINGGVVIPSNITLLFTGGAIIINNRANLTINSEIIAPLYKIFETNGNLTISTEKNTTGYPEWFGDDLAKAIELFQCVELQHKDYEIDHDVNITKDNFVLKGYSFSTFMNDERHGTRIIENGGRLIVGDISGRVINNFPRNITIENIEIAQLYSTLPVMNVYGVVYGRFKNLTFSCSGAISEGVHITKAVSTIFDSCRIQVTNNTGTFFGFNCTDDGNPIAAGGNASLYFKYCSVSDTGDTNKGRSYGWYLNGNSSDTFLDHCETTTCTIGLSISGANKEAGANDIFITNCIFDSCRETGVVISAISVNGAINLDNVYVAKDRVNNTTHSLFHIQNCIATILAKNLQGIALNENNLGLQLIGDCNGLFDGVFNGMNTPYTNNGSTTNVKVTYLHDGVLTNV